MKRFVYTCRKRRRRVVTDTVWRHPTVTCSKCKKKTVKGGQL